jgi:CRP/FNR family cyclic AMP-dependent transcriptional regulator
VAAASLTPGDSTRGPKPSTLAIALDGKCLRTKCEENHDLGYELLKRFSLIMNRRLDATRMQLLDVYATR